MVFSIDGSLSRLKANGISRNKTYTASGSVNPYWTANGTSPNISITPTGKFFTRKGEWKIPVTRYSTSP